MGTGTKAGVAVGVIAGLAALISVGIFLYRRHANRNGRTQNKAVGVEGGIPGHLSDDEFPDEFPQRGSSMPMEKVGLGAAAGLGAAGGLAAAKPGLFAQNTTYSRVAAHDGDTLRSPDFNPSTVAGHHGEAYDPAAGDLGLASPPGMHQEGNRDSGAPLVSFGHSRNGSQDSNDNGDGMLQPPRPNMYEQGNRDSSGTLDSFMRYGQRHSGVPDGI